MAEKIWMSLAHVTKAEEAALVEAVNSGWVAPLGPYVERFERGLADFTGRAHCVALSSGTAALHLGLLTLGTKPGHVVITSSMTFAATANAITYTGARPVFVDADASGNVNPDLVAEAIDGEIAKGHRVAAVLPVDLLGKCVDHARIDPIAARHGIPVLSDAAESLGAVRGGRASASYGAAAALSFNGNKIMTTSGGGALLTDDEDLAKHVKYLATQARQPVIWYEHTDVGYNYRLSNLLAALGCVQLERLPEMMERRRWIRLAYREFFASVPGVEIFGGADGSDVDTRAADALSAPGQRPLSERSESKGPHTEATSPDHDTTWAPLAGTGALRTLGGDDGSHPVDGASSEARVDHDNFWLTSIVIDPDVAGFTSTELMDALAAADIESRPLWKPMHLQPVFRDEAAYVDGTSERFFRTGLSLPSGSGMTDEQFDRVLATIQEFVTSRA